MYQPPYALMQEHIEKRFNRKHINDYIRNELITNPLMVRKINDGVEYINEYMSKTYYESKNKRIKQLENLDIDRLVIDVFVGIAYCQREQLFTAVTAQMAGRLKFSDKVEAITTTAEIMAVLCRTDAFDIYKINKMASLMVISRIPLSDKLNQFIEESQYLPPMVSEPLDLENNYSSGYLTHNDSLILGQGNHHDGDICLDILNIMNKTELSLDLEFLSKVEEDPTFDIVTQDQMDQWKQFKIQSYRFYDLIQSHGNVFYLTHKVDKRGRIYAQGYHISTQGSPFKKAMIELAKQEIVQGVP